MKYLVAFLISLSFLPACVSIEKNTPPDYLSKISKLPLGADLNDITQSLGKDFQLEKEKDGSKLTYFMTYKSMEIPKVIIWLDSHGKVIGKHINLFKESEDAILLSEAERHIGKLKLMPKEISKGKRIHFISSVETFFDNATGVSLQVDQEQVRSISWYEPTSNRNAASE